MGNAALIPTYDSSLSKPEYEHFTGVQLLAARHWDHQKWQLGWRLNHKGDNSMTFWHDATKKRALHCTISEQQHHTDLPRTYAEWRSCAATGFLFKRSESLCLALAYAMQKLIAFIKFTHIAKNQNVSLFPQDVSVFHRFLEVYDQIHIYHLCTGESLNRNENRVLALSLI